jgi:hypothetical protein
MAATAYDTAGRTYETATATCQMVPLSEGLWHPLFTLRPFVVSTRSSQSQSTVTETWLVFFDHRLNVVKYPIKFAGIKLIGQW